MPSTCVRFLIVSSRSAGRQGAIVKPQLPITAVVTPSAGEGEQRRVPGDLRVEVGVAVDDAGHQRQAVGLDDARGASASPMRGATRAIRPAATATSARRGGAPLPSRQLGAADQEVDHYAVFSSGAANSDSISRRTL